MFLPVEHEREKHSLVKCDCICVSLCVSIFKFMLRMCVRDTTRSVEETRRLHESLDRMSGLCKNTMKEPKTESCQKLLCCMEMLNVLSRGSTSTCGGGQPVINHTNQQNPKEMPLFLVPAWCSELHQSYSVQSVRHKKGKQSLKTHEFLHTRSCIAQSGIHVCFKSVCKWFPAQIISVCLRERRYVSSHERTYPCIWMPVHKSPFYSNNMPLNGLRLIRDPFNYCNKVTMARLYLW